MITITEPKHTYIGNGMIVSVPTHEAQVARICEKELLKRGIIATIVAKPSKTALGEGFSTAWDIWSQDKDIKRRMP